MVLPAPARINLGDWVCFIASSWRGNKQSIGGDFGKKYQILLRHETQIQTQMVDWKRIEIITGPDAEAHIKKHGVSISEVFNVLNGLTYSRKTSNAGETRYTVLGDSHGRILI